MSIMPVFCFFLMNVKSAYLLVCVVSEKSEVGVEQDFFSWSC